MIKEYIKKIIENGKTEDMEKLSNMLEDVIYDIRRTNPEHYNEYKKCLYEMAYGKVITEEKAEKIIENMKPYGMHWTLEQTESVRKNYNLDDIRPVDFWLVMNMAYNDYHDLFNEDVEQYVKYTTMFIDDEDANDDKVYDYFTTIPKE